MKNKGVADAVDVIMSLMESEVNEPESKKPEVKQNNVKIMSYSCAMCTYVNPEGKASCEIC